MQTSVSTDTVVAGLGEGRLGEGRLRFSRLTISLLLNWFQVRVSQRGFPLKFVNLRVCFQPLFRLSILVLAGLFPLPLNLTRDKLHDSVGQTPVLGFTASSVADRGEERPSTHSPMRAGLLPPC